MADDKRGMCARETMRNMGKRSHLRKSASIVCNTDEKKLLPAPGSLRTTQELAMDQATQKQLADLRSPMKERRMEAIQAAESSGRPSSPEVLRTLEEALRDESDEVRAAAADALGAIGGVAQKTVLLLAISDRSWDVRAAVVKALGTLGDATPLLTLLQALYDEHYVVRISAIWALQRLGLARLTMPLAYEEDVQRFSWISQVEVEPTLLTAIEARVEDSNELVRAAVIEALGEFHDVAFSELFASVLNDPSELVRLEAVNALGKLDEKVFLDDLALKIKDPSELVQEEACKILRDLSPPLHQHITFETLLLLLEDEQENLRALAARQLGERGDLRATDYLLAAQTDASEAVQEATNWALEQLVLSEEQLQEESRRLQPEQPSTQAWYFLPGERLIPGTRVIGALTMIFSYLAEKRGFIVVDDNRGGCIALTIGYECSVNETTGTLRDQLSRYALIQTLEDIPQVDTGDIVSRDLAWGQSKLRHRPWLECFMLHLSCSTPRTQQMARGALSRIMINIIHVKTLRSDDVRIDQCQERYLLDGQSSIPNNRARSFVEETLDTIHEFDRLQIWHGSSRGIAQTPDTRRPGRERRGFPFSPKMVRAIKLIPEAL